MTELRTAGFLDDLTFSPDEAIPRNHCAIFVGVKFLPDSYLTGILQRLIEAMPFPGRRNTCIISRAFLARMQALLIRTGIAYNDARRSVTPTYPGHLPGI